MSYLATIDGDTAAVRVTPDRGRTVVFEVVHRSVRGSAPRYVVQCKGSTGDGFSSHRSFETAVRSLLARARRYDRAFAERKRAAA